MKTVVFSSHKERDGIAEYTRHVFSESEEISFLGLLAAPFRGLDIIHIQHEFFLFDRIAGLTALPLFLWLAFSSFFTDHRIVTTIHSVYNTNRLKEQFSHFRWLWFLFPLGRAYLRFYYRWLTFCSDKVIVLNEACRKNLPISSRAMEAKVRIVPIPAYPAPIKAGPPGDEFTLFGFAFPGKGYETAIEAAASIVRVTLNIVSGSPTNPSFPGGGQGSDYVNRLKSLANRLGGSIQFYPFLDWNSPVLADIVRRTRAFVFPYPDRDLPSGALASVANLGRPVIVSNVPAFDGCKGLIKFRAKDSADLARAMLSVNTQQLPELPTVEEVIEKHQSIYEECLPRFCYCEP